MVDRLASGFQLWRLNESGRLALVDSAEPLVSQQASEALDEELTKLGLDCFPTGTARRGKRRPKRLSRYS